MSNNIQSVKIATYFMVAVIAGIFTSILFLNGSTNSAFAQTDSHVVVHISSGNPEDQYEVNAANMGLTLANHFQDAGRNVTAFLDVNAVHLAVNNPPAGLENATTSLNEFITNGGSVIVCPMCLEVAGYSPEDVITGAIVANPEEGTMLPILNGNAIVIDY